MAYPGFDLSYRQTTRVGLKARLLSRLRVIELLSMPEKEFARLIEDLEKDPVFKKLIFPEPGKPRAIRNRRSPRARLSQSFYEINEQVVPERSSPDFETFIASKKEIIGLIQKLGQEKFERFFLYRENDLDEAGLARECGLTVEEVKRIGDLLTQLSVQAEFHSPGHLSSQGTLQYTPLAKIEPAGNDFALAYLSPHLARGRYEIDYDIVKDIRDAGKFSEEERRRINNVLNTVELVNLRQETLVRIMESVIDSQQEYLKTREQTKLAPISLRQLAAQLNLAPSTVSRAISAKSIYLPWGEESALIGLLPGHRKVVIAALKTLMDGEEVARKRRSKRRNHLPDHVLAEKLFIQFGLKVARRTVTACRHAMVKQNRRKKQ